MNQEESAIMRRPSSACHAGPVDPEAGRRQQPRPVPLNSVESSPHINALAAPEMTRSRHQILSCLPTWHHGQQRQGGSPAVAAGKAPSFRAPALLTAMAGQPPPLTPTATAGSSRPTAPAPPRSAAAAPSARRRSGSPAPSPAASCRGGRQVTTEEEEEEKKSRRSECHVSIDSAGSWQEGRALTIADVSKATSNFSEKNMIRQGRSSTMYRGKLKDGSQIAVKCVRKLNGQNLTAELWRELETLEKIEHRNLARLFGFFERTVDSLVVVEYVSNGSLREHLDESCGNGLELAQRLNIAIDVAQGITYLHEYKEHPVIHGGIRSSGVLLTDALTAKVAGFGLAGTAASGSGSGSGSDATPAKGAAGYVDPEYLSTYQLTDKSDVYSFGVLLVELVTGRPPIERSRGGEARLTTKWALQRCRAGEAVVVAMDPRMRRSPASVAAVERMLALAAQCVATARDDRPSMRRCSELLWDIRRDYHRQDETRCAAVAEERSDEWVVR